MAVTALDPETSYLRWSAAQDDEEWPSSIHFLLPWGRGLRRLDERSEFGRSWV